MAPHEIFDAIEAGDVERVRALAAGDPSVGKERNADGVSALLQARYHGRGDLVDELLRGRPELDLFEASAVGATERVRELVDEDPAIANAYSPDGFTPLTLAAFFGHPEVARVLLDRGADVSAFTRNEQIRVAPLQSAAAGSHVDVARLLLDAGAAPDVEEEGGFTPLHSAAQNGSGELVELLLERGGDASRRTRDGRSPADCAREAGHDELAERLARAAR